MTATPVTRTSNGSPTPNRHAEYGYPWGTWTTSKVHPAVHPTVHPEQAGWTKLRPPGLLSVLEPNTRSQPTPVPHHHLQDITIPQHRTFLAVAPLPGWGVVNNSTPLAGVGQ